MKRFDLFLLTKTRGLFCLNYKEQHSLNFLKSSAVVATRLKKYAVDKESLENSLWESTNSFTESRLEDNCNLFRFRPQLEPNQLKSSLLEHMLQFHFPSHTAYGLCPLFHKNSFNLFVKFASPQLLPNALIFSITFFSMIYPGSRLNSRLARSSLNPSHLVRSIRRLDFLSSCNWLLIKQVMQFF